MVSTLIEKLEELGLAEQGVVTPAQKMFAAMRLQGRLNTTNEYESNDSEGRGNAIPLLSTTIDGTSRIQNYRTVLDELTPGSSVYFVLSAADDGLTQQVLVLDAKRRHLGQLPHDDAAVAASLLSAGKQLVGHVESIDEKQSWTEVAITVYLYDT